MDCPVCAAQLKPVDRQGVEIDFCPQCKGVWLDRGELEKIIERAAGPNEGYYEQPGGYQPGYGGHHGGHHGGGHHGGYRRRKGFLGDLFDF